MQDLILKGLSKCVRDSLVDHTSPHLDDDRVCKDFVPLSIQLLRKYIIPKEGENKSPSEINHHLIRIENRMKINFLARQRFRRLLFCENEDLKNNPTVMNGYLSPLPKKSTKSASARLASRKKQKLLLAKQTLHQDNKFKEIEGNPENQTTVTRTIACTGFTKR